MVQPLIHQVSDPAISVKLWAAPPLIKPVRFSPLRRLNLLTSGKAPSTILPYLCGAALLVSRKKNRGLRPITVGEVLCRLVSKSLSTTTCHEVFNSLTPLQLGMSVKGGCEAIIHSVSQQHHLSNIGLFYIFDFSNDFTSINRESMFVEF